MNLERILSVALGNLFFALAPLLILPGYLYLFIKNRYNFSHPLSIFEIPLLLTSKATVLAISYFALNYTVKFLGFNNEHKVIDWASTGLFHMSIFLVTAANNFLLPLVCISCTCFPIGHSMTTRHITMWIASLIYVIVKYVIILQLVPDFINFTFTSNTSSKILVLCPLDIILITLSIILLSVRLCCSTRTINFEDLILVFESILVLSIKLSGFLVDMCVIGVFSQDPRTIIEVVTPETEIMLLKNYEPDQMILPYCIVLSFVLVQLEDIRQRTTVRINDHFHNGGPVKWFRFQKGPNSVNAAKVT